MKLNISIIAKMDPTDYVRMYKNNAVRLMNRMLKTAMGLLIHVHTPTVPGGRVEFKAGVDDTDDILVGYFTVRQYDKDGTYLGMCRIHNFTTDDEFTRMKTDCSVVLNGYLKGVYEVRFINTWRKYTEAIYIDREVYSDLYSLATEKYVHNCWDTTENESCDLYDMDITITNNNP